MSITVTLAIGNFEKIDVTAEDSVSLVALLENLNQPGALDSIASIKAALSSAGLVRSDSGPSTPAPSSGGSTASPGASNTGGPRPSCKHGEMSWVAPKGKTWKGWFCPLPQDAPASEKCKPEFVN